MQCAIFENYVQGDTMNEHLITDEIKDAVLRRQNGMCAVSGKKFEAGDDLSECEYYFINPGETGESADANNIAMIWNFSESPYLTLRKEDENFVFPKYVFPYANFENYGEPEIYEEFKKDAEATVASVKDAENPRAAKATLRDAIQTLRNLNLEKEHNDEVYSLLSGAMDEINQKESEEKRKFEAESAENYENMRSKVDEAVQFAGAAENFREARENLVKAQELFKNLKLKKDQRDRLLDALKSAFDDLNARQAEEREQYEMECIENYHKLKRIVEESIEFSATAENFRQAREKLIAAQGEFKGLKLQKDQREELFGRVRDAFDELNVRQEADREEFEKESAENYEKIRLIVDEAITFAKNSEDFRAAREALINAQNAIKELRLTRKQRDELFADIREVFEDLNERQNKERAEFNAECKENYAQLDEKMTKLSNDVEELTDFRLIRDNLIALQNEVKIVKLRRDQRNEVFKRIRKAFGILDKRRETYRESRRQEKQEKLQSILDNLEKKVSRIEESIERDKESYDGGEPAPEEIPENDEKKNAIESRIKDKESAINKTRDRITDIQNELSKMNQ